MREGDFVSDVHPVRVMWVALAGTKDGRIVLVQLQIVESGDQLTLAFPEREAKRLVRDTQESLEDMYDSES